MASKSAILGYLQLPQVRAALDTIAWAEGGRSYNVMFGGGTFSGNQHPCRVVNAGGYSSTAAGRYQFLCNTWKNIAARYGLTDFSPANQDFGALVEADDKGGLDSIVAGNFEQALKDLGANGRCAWAGLPYASWSAPNTSCARQPHKPLAQTLAYYNSALAVYRGNGTPLDGYIHNAGNLANVDVSIGGNDNDKTALWLLGGLVLLALI